MDLALFGFANEVLELYESQQASYQLALEELEDFFQNLDLGDGVVSVPSRLKSKTSLKEKLIRQEFFVKYPQVKQALSQISDLIGLTIQVRFVRHEVNVFENLFHWFQEGEKGYFAKDCPFIHLDLKEPQPQFQHNGCPIYRIDGWYEKEGNIYRFELQIKAMVHQFWSDIEHEVIYKNSDYVLYDQLSRQMLAAIRDNLETMDHQLELIYQDLSQNRMGHHIGLDELNFKVFLATRLNELVKENMEKSLDFSTDFQKASSTLAQLIYIKEFIQKDQKEFLMLDYFERMDELKQREINFTRAFVLEEAPIFQEGFLETLVPYLKEQANRNFQWHVFFRMIFEIQKEENIETMVQGIELLEPLLIQRNWFQEKMNVYDSNHSLENQRKLRSILALGLIQIGDIRCIYEENLIRISGLFRALVEQLVRENLSLDWFQEEFLSQIAKNL